MRQVAIIGAGGHGRVILDILSLTKDVDVIAFFDDDEKKRGMNIDGVTVQGRIADLGRDTFSSKIDAVVVAVGDNLVRAKLYESCVGLGYVPLNAIHPRSVISRSAKIGKGFVAMAGSIVNPGTVIGNDVCINTGATVDHDVVLADHCHVYPGANVTGGVRIGKYSTIGTNAAVNPYLTIGENVMVGSGALVKDDVPDNAIVVGVPARVVSHNKPL